MTLPANYVSEALNAAINSAPRRINRAINASVKGEARALLRINDSAWRLSRLLGLVPEAIGRIDVDARLKRAIATERMRAKAGHWTADRSRLIALRGHLLTRRYIKRYQK